MFIGHFGIGLGAKPLAPKVPLGTLFLAAQFLDLLWSALLLAGVERAQIAPDATRVTPLVFEHYPISHSLLAVLAWAVLVAGIYFLLRRDLKAAVVIGVLVISHWLLDAIVHQPDLPVFPDNSLLAGLGAWSSLPLTLAIEGSVFLLGAWVYVRCTTPVNAIGKWGLWRLLAFLAIIYAGNLFGAPPPNERAIAWAGQLQWLFVMWGYWVDKHRRT